MMPTDDEFYDLWKSDVINHLQLIYKKGYDEAKQELKREPLSYEEIENGRYNHKDYEYNCGFEDGVKFAEKAHGIGVDDE